VSDSQVKKWLSRAPCPARVRVDESDKKVIVVSNRANRWSELEKSLLAMSATTVEALNAQGEVLRVMQLKEPAEPTHEPQKEEWPASEQAQMAMVITASNDRAASRHEAIFKMSFDALKEMYQACLQELRETQRRCAQLESALQRELERQEVAVPAAEDENLISGLVAAIMPRLMAGGDAAKANGKDEHQ